jgi:hypothetical protein
MVKLGNDWMCARRRLGKKSLMFCDALLYDLWGNSVMLMYESNDPGVMLLMVLRLHLKEIFYCMSFQWFA